MNNQNVGNVNENTELQNAIQVLIKNLNEDEGYRLSWQANIAMSFKDEFLRSHSDAPVHDIANNAAINFLNILTKNGKESETL